MEKIPQSRNVIRVGSRKSELALIQTKHVIGRLQKIFPDEKFEIHTMTTVGDRVLNISLPKIGEKSLFTKDLEDALTNGSVDFVVHSLKDLPTCLPAGMAIGAILEREDPRDALVLNGKYDGHTLKSLPAKCVIGTSSLRRAAQLARCYPQLIVDDIRGNLNTRLAKLDAENSKFAGIILAQAGLVRMGWEKRINQTLDACDLLYAVGQGALAVECRSNDSNILDMLKRLSCLQTQCKILTERSFLKTLGGGCSAPVAVHTNLKRRCEHTKLSDYELEITGAVWSLDGTVELQSKSKCVLDLEDSDSIIEIPSKRIKQNDNGNVSSLDTTTKRRSPTIIDDSLVTAELLTSVTGDVDALMKIHGNAFKKCPFSMGGSQRINNNLGEICPIQIRVGQDVMAQCPYFDAHQQVLLESTASTSKLPEQNITVSTSQTKSNETVAVCPFKSLSCDTSNSDSVIPITDMDMKKCPFLSGNDSTKIIDKATEPITNTTSTKQCDTILYCGLYRHACFSQEILEKCEALGMQLAQNLINDGALKVMESAQLQIRQKI